MGYGSRTSVGAETKYHSPELEFLALKWPICEHFRDYLFYADYFDVCTDFNPLVYLKSIYKLSATDQRWINEMADYHFFIHCQPGTENQVAASLSRFPIQSLTDMSCYKEVVHDEQIKAVFNGLINHNENDEPWIPCGARYGYLLVITDHFSGFTQAYPIANKKAETAADTVISCLNLVCMIRFCMIRVQNLKMIFSRN